MGKKIRQDGCDCTVCKKLEKTAKKRMDLKVEREETLVTESAPDLAALKDAKDSTHRPSRWSTLYGVQSTGPRSESLVRIAVLHEDGPISGTPRVDRSKYDGFVLISGIGSLGSGLDWDEAEQLVRLGPAALTGFTIQELTREEVDELLDPGNLGASRFVSLGTKSGGSK